MKQNHELSYIISSQISEEASQEISRKINDFIQEKQGIVSESQLPKKIALGYPIRKEVFAWLQTTYFSFDSLNLSDLEKNLKEENNILRYLVLKTKPMRIRSVRAPRKPLETENLKPQKVDLGEIEKKLDEILKQD